MAKDVEHAVHPLNPIHLGNVADFHDCRLLFADFRRVGGGGLSATRGNDVRDLGNLLIIDPNAATLLAYIHLNGCKEWVLLDKQGT